MSGLFKNLEKVLNQGLFATKSHKFLLKQGCSRFSAAEYYFDPSVYTLGLSKGHGLDVYGLSACAYSLARQQNKHTQLLNEVTHLQSQHPDFHKEVQNQLQQTRFALDCYLKDFRLSVNTMYMDIPIESAVTGLYAFVQANSNKEAQQQLLESLKPTLAEKLQYASSQNLIDLVVTLEKMEYFSNDIWQPLLGKLNSKVWDWELTQVQTHGWDLNLYEQTTVKHSESITDLQKHWNNLRNGSAQLAQFKRYYQQAYNMVKYRAYYPICQREYRIMHEFGKINPVSEKKTFYSSVQNIENQVEGLKEFNDKLKSKQQNY